MTATIITDVLSELELIGEQAAARDREAAQHREAAERTRAESEELAKLATATATQGGNEVLRRLNTFMRQLSAEVSDARAAAIDAVHRGEGVADKWCQYRLVANRARGRWAALSGEYQRLTGRDAPPGPHRPELRAEPFEKFLHTTVIQAENDAYQQAQQEAHDEINARRDRRQAEPEADEQAATSADPPSEPQTRRESRRPR